jgi:hypothetical protein
MRARQKILVGAAGALVILAVTLLVVTLLTATSYASLQQALRAHGASVHDDGQGSEPFLGGTDHRLSVNSSDVDVFEYRTTLGASLDASRISSDGSTIRGGFGPFGSAVVVDFTAAPHWFHDGRIIVLYVGQNAALLTLFQDVLGPQFAGT